MLRLQQALKQKLKVMQKYPKPTYSLHASSPKSDTQKLLEHVSKINKG